MSLRHFALADSPWSFVIDRHRFRLAPETVFRGDPHTIDPVSFLAPQYSTSEAQVSYADVNRSVEIPVAQADFSGGVAKTLEYGASNARQFRYSKNIDTSGPAGTFYPAPKVSTIGAAITKEPTKAVQKGNITYVACHEDLYQITDASTRTLDTTFADPITDLIVWKDKLVVGFGEGSGTNIQYRVSDTIAGAFTDVGREGEYFAIVQNNPIGPVLYTSKETTIEARSDILSTSPWVAFQIGTSDTEITSLTAHGDHLIVGKTIGPYQFSTDYVSSPIIDRSLELQNYIKVCHAAISWNGLYIFSGKHSTYAWDGQRLNSVGFDILADAQMPGGEYRPASFTADPHFLYALVSQSTNPPQTAGIYIWKSADGGKSWHNYLWRSDLGLSSDLLFATNKLGSVSTNAVLFSYKSGSSWQLAYAPFPSVTDPTKDTAYTFDNVTEGVLRTCDYTGGLATTSKYSDRIKNVADHITITAPVNLYGYLDDEAALKLATFETSPHEELDLFQGQDYQRLSLEYRFTGASTAAATVQQIHGFELPIRFLSRVVNLHKVSLVAVDDMPLASGGNISPRARGYWKAIVNDLRERRRSQASVDCVDEYGDKFKAYLVDVAERTPQRADGGNPTKMLVVSLLEVTDVAA